ncbi:MAG: hypothetical protein LUQ69_02350 [Methanoregulaceae archaeon]|jgi:hypothetical protein|nr:hypothetical protein [Methanoregulaceae archaeon]
MGSNQDIMHEFVKKELIRAYPSSEGWDVSTVDLKGKNQAYLAKRRSRGKTEMSYILVTFDRKITKDALTELAGIKKTPTATSVLIVPQAADVTLVPAGVRVRYMRSFAFEDKDLVWIRKRLQSPPSAAPVAA